MPRIDTDPNDSGIQVFHEYPKCMKKQRADGEYDYRDALHSADEQAAIAQGWEPNGQHDERAFDKASNAQALPDDYSPVEYPKFIAVIGKDVYSREEEERLLGVKDSSEETKTASLSLQEKISTAIRDNGEPERRGPGRPRINS